METWIKTENGLALNTAHIVWTEVTSGFVPNASAYKVVGFMSHPESDPFITLAEFQAANAETAKAAATALHEKILPLLGQGAVIDVQRMAQELAQEHDAKTER